MLSLIIFESKSSFPEILREFTPRSDKARLIDLVKFRGVVDGSRKSENTVIDRMENILPRKKEKEKKVGVRSRSEGESVSSNLKEI